MDIQEFKKRKAEMEADIVCAIQGVVGAFKRDTGFAPRSIEVEMVDVTEVGDVNDDFEVANVKTFIDI